MDHWVREGVEPPASAYPRLADHTLVPESKIKFPAPGCAFAANRQGDKVVMWYISGNRDESVIKNPDAFIVNRTKPRQHLAYGAGIHRCVGDRLADLQLRILWEEILARDLDIEVVGPPKRLYSNFIRGIRELPVRINTG
jgi:cytochrome P450